MLSFHDQEHLQLIDIGTANANSKNLRGAHKFLQNRMMNLRDPTRDDTAVLVEEDEAGIIFRLFKCGPRCRLVLIPIVFLLLIGAIVAVVIIFTRGK